MLKVGRGYYEREYDQRCESLSKALACYDGTLHPRATGSQYGVGRGSHRNEYNGNRKRYF